MNFTEAMEKVDDGFNVASEAAGCVLLNMAKSMKRLGVPATDAIPDKVVRLPLPGRAFVVQEHTQNDGCELADDWVVVEEKQR